MPAAFNLEQAFKLVRQIGLEPLFTVYQGSQKKHLCKCPCGETFELLFSTINRRLKKNPLYQLRCKKCNTNKKTTKYSAEKVFSLFRNHGAEPLFSKEFWEQQSRNFSYKKYGRLHLPYRCSCNKESWTILENLIQKINKNPEYHLKCHSCAILQGRQVTKKRTQIKQWVLDYFTSYGLKVENLEDINKNTTPIIFYCKCGNIHKTTWMSLQQCQNEPSCQSCQIKNKVRGDAHPRWDSSISFQERMIREEGQTYTVKKWGELLRAIYEYKCQITGKISNLLNCHHIYPVKSHPDKKYLITNGIPLRQDLHVEFHSRFGKHVDNSKEFFTFYKEKTGKEWIIPSHIYPEIIENSTYDLLAMKKSFALKNIDYIPLFLGEITINKSIIASMLKSRMGLITNKINARDLTVKEIYDSKKVSEFLTKNHRQGEVPSFINIGLENAEGEIISLMTFGEPRFSKQAEIELLRFCSKINTIVHGAAQKIFSYFIEKFKPNSVISYADIRFSSLNPEKTIYHLLGFKYLRSSQPNYWYTKDFIILESRQKYQKHKLKELLPSFDESLTEEENMTAAGFFKIKDCGNHVFIWNPPLTIK